MHPLHWSLSASHIVAQVVFTFQILYRPLGFLDFHVSIGTLWQDNSSIAVLSFMASSLARPVTPAVDTASAFLFLDPAPEISDGVFRHFLYACRRKSPVCHTGLVQCRRFAARGVLRLAGSTLVKLHISKKQGAQNVLGCGEIEAAGLLRDQF